MTALTSLQSTHVLQNLHMFSKKIYSAPKQQCVLETLCFSAWGYNVSRVVSGKFKKQQDYIRPGAPAPN